jgi:hypothetical protein
MKIYMILCFILILPLVLAASDSPKLESEKPFLGVYLSPRDDLKQYGEKYSGQKGLYIPLVLYQSAAEDAGILSGDVILNYDDIQFENVGKSRLLKTFKNYIRDEKKIHEPLKLNILREKQFYKGQSNQENIEETPFSTDDISDIVDKQLPGKTITLNIYKEVSELTITAILGRRPHMRDIAPPSNAKLFPHYENQTNANIQKIELLIKDHSLQNAYDDLVQRLSDNEWWDDGFRTSFFRYAHRDPKKFPMMIEDLTQKIATSIQNGINAASFNQHAALLMDVSGSIADMQTRDMVMSPTTSLISRLRNYYARLIELHEHAFSRLTPEECDLLKNQTPIMMKRFIDHYYLDINANVQEMKYHRKVSALAKKIDYKRFYQASCLLQYLAQPQLKSNFEKTGQTKSFFDTSPDKLGISGDVHCIKKIDSGYIVIGGPGFTRYTKPLSWIIDLGGDDLYLNDAGAATYDNKVSIVIDLQGNDQYTATENWAQGAGFMGFGVIIDFQGEDRYTAIGLSQGCGVMGVGHLIDLRGDDQYHGQEFHQGLAFWGLGSLIDFKGNDSYHGALFSQAVGGTYGLGILVDVTGNDHYYATGKHKSSYATDGIFRSSSQGFGIGFRGIASGGIGILLDLAGADHFMAGNFAQGGGYFFGMGILKNAGTESDVYVSSRYGQGFSAHSAAGILIDDGGNDIYRGLHGAIHSAAWDLGIAALVDYSGNDQYHAAFTFFSQGAAAHNGFSIFLDHEGLDQYWSDQGGIAKKQSNDYHKGNSLGFFIDLGNELDTYQCLPSTNNLQYVRGEYSIFCDE